MPSPLFAEIRDSMKPAMPLHAVVGPAQKSAVGVETTEDGQWGLRRAHTVRLLDDFWPPPAEFR